MHPVKTAVALAAVISAVFTFTTFAQAGDHHHHKAPKRSTSIEVGPRPHYLVSEMSNSRLKRKLQRCADGPFYRTDFSIGHRGAALQFPEHTKESYEAAARMGAGILECDVTFTKDRELVCRHSQCDLHTTTNILVTPLANKCTQDFLPADSANPARAQCCTSDITLAEFKTLCGKMDASNRSATTREEFLGGTANWRTDLYTTCGTLLSHKESIKLFKGLGTKFTPELKAPSVPMPFEGDYTQEDYAQQMIDEYKAAHVPPRNVWAQSFNLDDVRYWINNNPRFGKQAVYLDGRYNTDVFNPNDPATWTPTMDELVADGVKIVAPPMWVLLTLNAHNKIVPSAYARHAKWAGLDIITWTLERSGRLIEDMKEGSGGTFYYQSTLDAINNDGDMLVTLDVLAKKVGILGIFSDWAGTVTYYANCMGL